MLHNPKRWERRRNQWFPTDIPPQERPAPDGGLPVTGVEIEAGELPVGPAIVFEVLSYGARRGQWSRGRPEVCGELCRIACPKCGLTLCPGAACWSISKGGCLWPLPELIEYRDGHAFTGLFCPDCGWGAHVRLAEWRERGRHGERQ